MSGCAGTQTPESVPSAEDLPGTDAIDSELVCLADAAGASGDLAERPALNRDTVSFELDSGVRVILKQTPGNPVVAARLWIEGGTRDASPETAGVHELAMSIATSGGTATLPRIEYTAALSAMGSSISADAAYDFNTLSMGSLRTYLPETWELFGAVIRTPGFPESEVERQRQLHVQGVLMRQDNPDDQVVDVARGVLFEGHAYSNEPRGTVETLSSFTREQLIDAYRAQFDVSRMLLVIVGDLDQATAIELIDGTFTGLPDSGERAPDVPAFPARETRVEVEPAGIPTNYILGLAPAPAPTDPDYAAMVLAMDHLSDRFFEEVRSNRNLTYAVSARIGGRLANYAYYYVTAVDPGATIPVMYDEIRRLQEQPLTEADMNGLISVFVTGYYTGIDSNAAIARELGWWELFGGGREQVDGYIDQLRAVSAEDIQRVARTYLNGFQVGVVGDPETVSTELFEIEAEP